MMQRGSKYIPKNTCLLQFNAFCVKSTGKTCMFCTYISKMHCLTVGRVWAFWLFLLLLPKGGMKSGFNAKPRALFLSLLLFIFQLLLVLHTGRMLRSLHQESFSCRNMSQKSHITGVPSKLIFLVQLIPIPNLNYTTGPFPPIRTQTYLLDAHAHTSVV